MATEWEVGSKVKALYDFQAQPGSGELSLIADEVLSVSRQDVGDGWWEGTNSRGESGLFPAGYVQLVPSSSFAPEVPKHKSPPAQPDQFMPPPPPPQGQGQGAITPNFDSADGEWGEDDWDDDDSQASTSAGDSYYSHAPGSGGGGGPGVHGVHTSLNAPGTGKHAQQQPAVRKSYNRFSTFVKSGGEDYILGNKNKTVPTESFVYIQEAAGGRMAWAPSQHPYDCHIASPKKESKLKGLKSYIAYQLTPTFNSIQVSRRYKHFDWLQGRLEEKFMTIPIPPLPNKQVTGRYQEEFIEHRKNQLQLWVNRICRHPVLSQSEVWMHFITCTDEKRWKAGKRRAEKDEFVGASFFFTIQPPEETLDVPTVDKQTEQFGRFASKMDDAVKNLFNVAQDQSKRFSGPYRREFGRMSAAFGLLADAFSMSNAPDADGALNEALRNTSQTYENIGKLYEEQPKYDFEPISDSLYEYKGILSAWPEILQVHKGALNRKKEYLKLHDEGKVDSAAGRSVTKRADIVSYGTLAEINQFQTQRVSDFNAMMQTFLTSQIKFYTDIASQLQETLNKYQQS